MISPLRTSSFSEDGGKCRKVQLAERGGFEPPIRLPVCRISSAVLSTTQPPLQVFDLYLVTRRLRISGRSLFATELLPLCR